MRGFIVLCLSAVAFAAPQGYNYNVGSSGVSAPLGGGVVSHGPSAGYSQTYNQPASFQGGNVGLGGLGGGNGGFLSHGAGVAPAAPAAHAPQQHQAVVTKRFFIHTAPEENDDQYQEKHITVGVPRKNYNVVFIKSPNRAHKKSSIKITPAVNEEKTVIYVLNKKADAHEIDAQVLEQPAVNSKPEVFFIKYKTAEEAQHAQQEIQSQYDALGGSSQVTDEGVAPVSSVIGSLGGGDGAGAGPSIGAANLSGPIVAGNGGHGGSNAYLPPNFK